MKDITAPLVITDSSIQGSIHNVPAGKARNIEVVVYDSAKTAIYRGFTIADIIPDTTNSVSIIINRIVGLLNINGTILESPADGWSESDEFESGALSSKWRPYSASIGDITGERAHTGTHAFKVSYSDFIYSFQKPITNGKISWWYWDNSGTPWTYLYILTDTTKVDKTLDNLHMVTNLAASYGFYHYSNVGPLYSIARTAGWRQFTATIANGKISMAVDGVVGITVDESKPVIAFQVAGAIIDDFNVVSNTN